MGGTDVAGRAYRRACCGIRRSKVSLAFSEARAGELEERVGYLVLGPAGFRCALSQFLEGRFQGELALQAAIRMVGRAAWFHDRNA